MPPTRVFEGFNGWGFVIWLASEYEKFHGDGSMTVTHVYWTLEAAESFPGCDHRHVR